MIDENSEAIKYGCRIIKEKCRIEPDSAFITVWIEPLNDEMQVLLRKENDVWKVDLTDNEIIESKVESDMDKALEIMSPLTDSIMVQTDTSRNK